MQDASKLHLILIWLLASQRNNLLPYDPEWIKQTIHATENVDLDVLRDAGFILLKSDAPDSKDIMTQDASKTLAHCLQDADTETYKSRENKDLNPIVPFESKTSKKKKDWSFSNYTSERQSQIKEVIEYLNSLTGSCFGFENKTSSEGLHARLQSGESVATLKTIIENRWAAWEHKPDMREFVRPETLFAPKKFEGYKSAALSWERNGKPLLNGSKPVVKEERGEFVPERDDPENAHHYFRPESQRSSGDS